jgi:hypothetical protein
VSADSGKDRLGDKLRDLEHAREEQFFSKRDRELIEQLRARQHCWHAEVVDLKALVEAVADGNVPLAALLPNREFLDEAAIRDHEALAIPGVRAVEGVAK